MDDAELQQRLTRLAERTAPPPREQLAGAVVAQHRAQRRQRIGVTGLVAARGSRAPDRRYERGARAVRSPLPAGALITGARSGTA